MKRFWVKLKNSEHSILVEAETSDFEKKGLTKFKRINKDGQEQVVMFDPQNAEMINEDLEEVRTEDE